MQVALVLASRISSPNFKLEASAAKQKVHWEKNTVASMVTVTSDFLKHQGLYPALVMWEVSCGVSH